MVKEVASKTSDIAGGGTTTATVLAQAIYREGARNVVAGANPMEIRRGIERAVEVITADLVKMSAPVAGRMVAQVGTISANNDEAIGTIIAEAMERVGKDGVITVEESKTMDTSLDIVLGPAIFAPFELETPPWRKVLKWTLIVVLTLGLYSLVGHWALALPIAAGVAGTTFHFGPAIFAPFELETPPWRKVLKWTLITATPGRRYYELRGWRWRE
jgi:hypothetical protein